MTEKNIKSAIDYINYEIEEYINTMDQLESEHSIDYEELKFAWFKDKTAFELEPIMQELHDCKKAINILKEIRTKLTKK